MKAFEARLHSGTDPAEMLAGLQRYAEYIRATGQEGTEYVLHAATFFGPDERWKDPWEIPVRPYHGNGAFVG